MASVSWHKGNDYAPTVTLTLMQGTQNIANNVSPVNYELKINRPSNINSSASKAYTIIINGQKIVGNTTIGGTGTKSIKTGTINIPHNADGTKSINFSFSLVIDITWGGTKLGTATGSGTLQLKTIPRASSISSASNVTLGNTCSIKWTPNAKDFKYKIKFSLGSWSHTTEYISPPNGTSAYTYTGYTIPLTVANQLPNVITGTMTAYLYTYNGGTQIGATQSKTFTVTIPSSIKPTLGEVTATIVNDNETIRDWNIAVAGYTKIKIDASAGGSYSSTIKSFAISGGYSATQNANSLSYTGGVITSSGDKTFTVSARDSRNRNTDSKTTNTILFYAYTAPQITSFTVTRSTGNAKQMVVKANWNYSSVGGRNTATATLSYKKATDYGWTNYGTIDKNASITLENDFDEAFSYNFKIIVTDSLSKSAQEEAFVSTIAVLLDFRAGGKGLGIGKIAETDSMEVCLPSEFMDDVSFKCDKVSIVLTDEEKQSYMDYNNIIFMTHNDVSLDKYIEYITCKILKEKQLI